MPLSLYGLVSSPSANTSFTKLMFGSLLARLRPDLVLDVGSRDGKDALRFKRIVPEAEVVAFEANPALCARMRADAALAEAGVQVEGLAVADYDGQGSFQVFNAAKGTGSLLPRRGKPNLDRCSVEVRRLESLFAASAHQSVALWIDAEGISYEVIKGCGKLLDRVVLVHAEVEAKPLFDGQVLRPAFAALMRESGFVHVDGGILRNGVSGNEVFLRSSIARRPSVVLHVTAFKLYLQLWHALHRLGLLGVARAALRPLRRMRGRGMKA